jgi:hypothetical protein
MNLGIGFRGEEVRLQGLAGTSGAELSGGAGLGGGGAGPLGGADCARRRLGGAAGRLAGAGHGGKVRRGVVARRQGGTWWAFEEGSVVGKQVGRRKSRQPAETLARRRARAMSATMAAQVVAATSELGAIGYGAELRVQNMK